MEINRRLTNVSFLEKLKKTDKKELIGDTWTEFQLSTSANLSFNCVVNFVRKVL